jgi:hypothetical protein
MKAAFVVVACVVVAYFAIGTAMSGIETMFTRAAAQAAAQ